MTPEEFRVAAHELIDWLVDRRVAIEERPVRPPVEPGDIKHALPSAAPTGGDDPRALIADLDAKGIVVEHLELRAPSLDDVFAEATGHRLEGAS